MAKKKTTEPPPDMEQIEVLPGVLIHVLPSEDFNAEALNDLKWPQVAAAAPLIGDFIVALDGPVAAVVVARGHRMTEAGPVLMLHVRSVEE